MKGTDYNTNKDVKADMKDGEMAERYLVSRLYLMNQDRLNAAHLQVHESMNLKVSVELHKVQTRGGTEWKLASSSRQHLVKKGRLRILVQAPDMEAAAQRELVKLPDSEKRGESAFVLIPLRELLRAGGAEVPTLRDLAADESCAVFNRWQRYKAEAQGDAKADYDVGITLKPSKHTRPADGFFRDLAEPAGGQRIVIEVKVDRQAAATGNYFSETRRLPYEKWQQWEGMKARSGVTRHLKACCFDYVDSALLTSKAPWYAVLLGRVILLVPTGELKELTLRNGSKEKDGGDEKRTRGVLLKLEQLLELGGEEDDPFWDDELDQQDEDSLAA